MGAAVSAGLLHAEGPQRTLTVGGNEDGNKDEAKVLAVRMS